MKDPFTGEMSGPPLEHSEWLAEQERLQTEEAERNAAEKSRRATAKRQAAGNTAEDEPTFHGKPLSAYDKYADKDALMKLDGVGEKTADEILAARKKAAKK
jgi:3-methyladenine DNA glycosylase/8-oxoguanine DNA glycosylase